MAKKKNRTCAWCKKFTRDGQPVWSLPCKSKINLTKKEAYFTDTTLLSGKIVTALVTSEDSQAKANGIDFVFMCCSEKCAQELKKALEQDERMINIGPLRG